MGKHSINNFTLYNKKDKKMYAKIVYDFLDNAKQICLKYHKIIEGFYLVDKMCYFVFNNTHLHELDENIPIYSVNNINDEDDWDMIELYGIIDFPQFQTLINIYQKYNDSLNLSQTNIQLVKEHQFQIEQSI